MIDRDPLLTALRNKYKVVKGAGTNWLRIACPTCTTHNAKKFKRYVPRVGYSSNCFICGVRLDIREMLVDQQFIAHARETENIDDEVHIDPRSLELPYLTATHVNKLPLDHPAVKFLHKDYLFDLDKYSNDHQIVYVPYEGGIIFVNSSVFITSAEHLVFPVYESGKLVGWQLRSVPGTFYGDMEKDIRYYHIFNKGAHLYNYDNAKKFNRVIVVEGVKKALKFPNAVATWGTGISTKQCKLIQEWPEVIMMLDGEDHNNTQTKAKEIVAKLKASGKKAINVDLRKYGAVSPDDLPSDILQQIADKEWNEQTSTT